MKRSSKITAMFAAVVMAATAVPAAAFAQDAQAVTAEVEVPGAKKDISGFDYLISGGEDQIYTGSKINPRLHICENQYSDDLYEGEDYTVTYKNNKKIGTGKIIVKGIGEYTGTKTLKFNIVPANPVNVEVKSKNNKITLSWKKDSQATKYRIFYSVALSQNLCKPQMCSR